MELSILVAKILALYYLALGVGVLSGKLNVGRMIKSFEDSPGLTLMTGFILIIIGTLLFQYHNIWGGGWNVLITIIGWLTMIKGVLLIAFPRVLFSFKGLYKNTKVLWVVPIALGLLFGYFGFVA